MLFIPVNQEQGWLFKKTTSLKTGKKFICATNGNDQKPKRIVCESGSLNKPV